MIKKRLFLIFSCLFSLIGTSIVFICSCSSTSNLIAKNTIDNPNKPIININPNNPNQKIEPEQKPIDPPIIIPPPPTNIENDIDNIKRTINVPYLQGVIKTNDFGYNPDSFQKTIYKYQKENAQTFLNHIFTDKKITNWESIKNLNVTKDDVLGSSTLSFDYGGTHNYSVNLTKNDGLLSDASYYEKMDDLSFAFGLSFASIVSGRDFPIEDNKGNIIRDNGASDLAGYTNKTKNKVTVTTKGTKIKNQNNYVK